MLQGRFLAPGGSRKFRAASKEVSGGRAKPTSPKNGGLRALGEVWMATFGLRHFPVKSGVFLCFFGRVKGSLRILKRSRVVQEGAGKPRAPERWPESSGRGISNDFLIEAFFCQVWSFSVFWGVSRWLQEVSSCVQGDLRRSGEADSSRLVA